MAIDYNNKLFYINSSQRITEFNFLNPLPDKCPVCNVAISPEYFIVYDWDRSTTELVCGCPRNECGALFIAIYRGNEMYSQLERMYPYTKNNKEFPEEIINLSPDFVEIYNQAHHAEQDGLDLICGVGYRKALEYIIKDFAILNNPNDTSKIQSMPLQQCVQKFIDQNDIKDMAERAIWLGNDETHYVRKWDSKDIKDLKNLIDLTVYYLSMTLKAKKYKEEMTK